MAFIEKTLDFCTATQIGVDSIPRGLPACLRDWWEHHIQDTDKAYSALIVQRINFPLTSSG